MLHVQKLNVSTWFDGSEVVGIWQSGYRHEKWCMKLQMADWQPIPKVYRLAHEAERRTSSAISTIPGAGAKALPPGHSEAPASVS